MGVRTCLLSGCSPPLEVPGSHSCQVRFLPPLDKQMAATTTKTTITGPSSLPTFQPPLPDLVKEEPGRTGS